MPTILCCFILFILWFAYERKKAEKNSAQDSKAYWDKEQAANFSPRKDISKLHYIIIPYDELPFCETSDEELDYVQKQIYKLKDSKILNLNGMSNTDLKLKYGIANFNNLTIYDQNYLLLIRHLNKWGQILYSNKQYDECLQVLSYAVQIGSDISYTYITLAKVAQKKADYKMIEELIQKAELLNTPVKNSLLSSLQSIATSFDHNLELNDQ